MFRNSIAYKINVGPTKQEQKTPSKLKSIKQVLFTMHRTDSLKQDLKEQCE